jgi:hypothetical protein
MVTIYGVDHMLNTLQGQARISDQEGQRLQTLYGLLRGFSARFIDVQSRLDPPAGITAR